MKTCKKLLAITIALVLLVSTLVSGLVVSAAEVGTLVLTSQPITESDADQTVTVDLTFDYTEAVAAPHNLVTLSTDSTFVLESIVVTSVNGIAASEYDTETDPEGEVSANPCPIYIKENGINLSEGKFILEAITVDSNSIEDVVITATYTIPANTVAGEYPVTATADYTDYYECDDTLGITNCDIVVEAAVVEPDCEHANITYVSHVAPIDGGANGSITYTCTDCDETFTEEVLYDNTFKFDTAAASYEAETILIFNFATTAANWSGVDQTKSFAILTKDNNDDEGDGTPEVKVQYISELTENGTKTGASMTYPLAAAELNDNVARQIIVYKNGLWYSRKVGNYSFVQYAKTALPGAEDTLVTLLMDLLDYGSVAQSRFTYNSANPANTADASFASYSGSANEIELTNNVHTDNRKDRYRFNSVAASFESRAEMNFLITDTTTSRNDLSDTSLVYVEVAYTDAYGEPQVKRINGDEFRVTSSGKVYVDFAELYATQMRQEVAVTLYAADDNSVQYIAYYSLEYFAAANVTTAESEITEACIRFGDSAAAHFNK